MARPIRVEFAVAGWRFGYRDGSGVADVLQQVEVVTRENATLAEKLRQTKLSFYRLQS